MWQEQIGLPIARCSHRRGTPPCTHCALRMRQKPPAIHCLTPATRRSAHTNLIICTHSRTQMAQPQRLLCVTARGGSQPHSQTRSQQMPRVRTHTNAIIATRYEYAVQLWAFLCLSAIVQGAVFALLRYHGGSSSMQNCYRSFDESGWVRAPRSATAPPPKLRGISLHAPPSKPPDNRQLCRTFGPQLPGGRLTATASLSCC